MVAAAAASAAPSARVVGSYESFADQEEPFNIMGERLALISSQDLRLPTIACHILGSHPLSWTMRMRLSWGSWSVVQLPLAEGRTQEVALSVQELAKALGIEKKQAQTLIGSYEMRTRLRQLLRKIAGQLDVEHAPVAARALSHIELAHLIQVIFRTTIARLLDLQAPLDEFVAASCSHQVYIGQQAVHCFETREMIARGGCGEVYRCHELFTGKPFATKFISLDLFEAASWKVSDDLLVREYSTLQQLSKDVEGIQKSPFLFFPIEGTSFHGYITHLYEGSSEKFQPQNKRQLLQLLQRIQSALSYLKSQRRYHGDIKPPNILMGPQGYDLCDWAGSQTLPSIHALLERVIPLLLQTAPSDKKARLKILQQAIDQIALCFTPSFTFSLDYKLLQDLFEQLAETCSQVQAAAQERALNTHRRSQGQQELKGLVEFSKLDDSRAQTAPSALIDASLSGLVDAMSFSIQILKIMQSSDIYSAGLSFLLLIDGRKKSELSPPFKESYWQNLTRRIEGFEFSGPEAGELVAIFQEMTRTALPTTDNHQIIIEQRFLGLSALEDFFDRKRQSAT